MASDKVLSQVEIDALVSKVPTKKVPSPNTNAVAPAIKTTEPSASVSNIPTKPSQPPVANVVATASKPSESPSAQAEYDPLPARLARLESNYQIVKSELQAILLDLREKYLEAENPFNAHIAPSHPPANTRQTETSSK